MGLVYDTASAQVIQAVKIGVSPDIIPTEINLDSHEIILTIMSWTESILCKNEP